jgi:hypothetical protein
MDQWIESTAPWSTGARATSNWGRRNLDLRSRFKNWRVIPGSNRDRSRWIRRCEALRSKRTAARPLLREAPWQAAGASLPWGTQHGGSGSNPKKEVVVTTTLTPRWKHGEGWLQDGLRRRPTLPSFDGGKGELQGPEQAGDGSNGFGGVPWCSTLAWLRARWLVATQQRWGAVARVSVMNTWNWSSGLNYL